MRTIPGGALGGCLLLLLAGLPAAAQGPDYLTEEEIQKVRETQEPNKRIALFLEFAGVRLTAFEKALAASSPVSTDDLTEMIDHYIRALDDATSNLEIWLERGGADLSKARKEVEKQTESFLARLEALDKAHRERLEEFRFTWEDSLEATQELRQVAEKVPAGVVPAKRPARPEPEEAPGTPGRPTLRKKDEPPKPSKPESPTPAAG
jgi:hypothetical protein